MAALLTYQDIFKSATVGWSSTESSERSNFDNWESLFFWTQQSLIIVLNQDSFDTDVKLK